VRDGSWTGPTAVHVPRAYANLNLGLFLGTLACLTLFLRKISYFQKQGYFTPELCSTFQTLEKIFCSMLFNVYGSIWQWWTWPIVVNNRPTAVACLSHSVSSFVMLELRWFDLLWICYVTSHTITAH